MQNDTKKEIQILKALVAKLGTLAELQQQAIETLNARMETARATIERHGELLLKLSGGSAPADNSAPADPRAN